MGILLNWMLLLILILEIVSKANGGDANINDTVVSLLEQQLKRVPQSTPDRCIFRVPRFFRAIEEAYTPQLVSIGPLHRDAENLKPMKVHKLRYLKDFLSRAPEMNMEYFVTSLTELEGRARLCYGEAISLTRDEFVEMMLVDGAFIIEFMFRSNSSAPQRRNDSIFSSCLMELNIKKDMELLENQLPFFVIDHLFNLITGPNHTYGSSFFDLAIQFFFRDLRSSPSYMPKKSTHFKSFVDIFRVSLALSSPRRSPEDIQSFKFIPTATELHGAGITFKSTTEKSLLDISFKKRARVFTIPFFLVTTNTKTILQNVIALEQFSSTDSSYVTDYVRLMDSLINTEDDVKFLRRKGIISYLEGDDQAVADLFNKLGAGTVLDYNTFYYAALFEHLNDYYEVRWHFWGAKLMRDNFNSPSSILSLISATLLLICTVIQTQLAWTCWLLSICETFNFYLQINQQKTH